MKFCSKLKEFQYMYKKEHGHKIKKAVEILCILIAIAIAYYFIVNSPWAQKYLNDPQQIKNFALGFGAIAPLFLIFLQAIQNILPLLPHEVTAVAAGFIFGPILGAIYTLIGAFLGSAAVFVIARKYGKSLAEHLFNKKEMVHFHLFFKQNKAWTIFIARLIPLFPNDLVSFAAGLTDIKFFWFNIASTAGFIFEVVILTYFGSELSTGLTATPIIIISIFVISSILIGVFKHQIKRILIKDIHRLEKDGRWIEKEFKKI
ncbi:MAG: TVP38/TMEM64 family protein [Nanoarchaeota archaeon]